MSPARGAVRGVAVGAALALGVVTAAAQATPAPIRISVITIGQGDEVFERFGHNALRVQDPATGLDVSYNWGMFSFDEPGFIRRFLSGDTRYWVEAIPTAWMLEQYAKADRESQEQVLAFTPAEAARVAALAAESALPANKYYRYDYFLDNCSTRVRDLLDRALDGGLQRRFGEMRTPWSFRSEAVRLTEPSAFAQAGIDIALGPRADAPITAWQSMFIPMRLRDYLRTVTIAGPDGAATPLVAEELVLYEAQRPPEAAERRGLALGAWGPLLAVWMLILVPWSAVVRRRTRVPAAVMTVLWYGFTAVLGVALAGMWIGSAHVFWYDNLNLLLLSPLGIVAAVPVARAILRGTLTPLSRVLLLAMLAQVVLAILLAPFVRQTLAGPILLLAPAHLGLALAAWRHTHLAEAMAAPVGSAR